MTAPNEPNDTTAAELGSTAQFKAFVRHNDDPDDARDRAAPDPDGQRAGSVGRDAHDAPAADDREIQFSEPVHAGPPVRSLRPEVELPPAELGSTAQFRAFASGEGPARTDGVPAPRSRSEEPSAAKPQQSAPPRPAAQDGVVAPALPPADSNSKRNLLISLAVVLLVVVAVVLLFILV